MRQRYVIIPLDAVRSSLGEKLFKENHRKKQNMGSQQIEVRNSFESDDETKPIVAVFSWAGGKSRYLKKYCSIFEEQGFTTISLASPILPAYLSTGGFSRKRRRRIVRILTDLTEIHKSRPIILMSFCQVYTLQNITQCYQILFYLQFELLT